MKRVSFSGSTSFTACREARLRASGKAWTSLSGLQRNRHMDIFPLSPFCPARNFSTGGPSWTRLPRPILPILS
ncbi:MAG: hypothetical protein MZU79_00245 [Anaerotruncus sp.]|nr:hypothetical protein [Anaerotruncus sp.]